jgi:hypothetical protein
MRDSGDPFLMDLADQAEQIKGMFDRGDVTNAEYIDLLNDLVRSKNINAAVQDLALKEKINGVLNALVALSGAV